MDDFLLGRQDYDPSDEELSEIIQTARAKQNNSYKLTGSL